MAIKPDDLGSILFMIFLLSACIMAALGLSASLYAGAGVVGGVIGLIMGCIAVASMICLLVDQIKDIKKK